MLAIRIEVELIFKNSYKFFFSKEQHEKVSKVFRLFCFKHTQFMFDVYRLP